jgi:hypothetical protein
MTGGSHADCIRASRRTSASPRHLPHGLPRALCWAVAATRLALRTPVLPSIDRTTASPFIIATNGLPKRENPGQAELMSAFHPFRSLAAYDRFGSKADISRRTKYIHSCATPRPRSPDAWRRK